MLCVRMSGYERFVDVLRTGEEWWRQLEQHWSTTTEGQAWNACSADSWATSWRHTSLAGE